VAKIFFQSPKNLIRDIGKLAIIHDIRLADWVRTGIFMMNPSKDQFIQAMRPIQF